MDDRREVVVTADGPLLVTGPVEVVLPDGRRVRSDRPVTALCVCRRSRRAPFCDTSHRRKARDTGNSGDTGDTETGNDEESRAQPHPTTAR
jgi:CDGSH-type Zn-finger protein